MALQGKGFFVWKVPGCENGDVGAIASLARSAGLTHVLVKIANGVLSYNVDPTTGVDYAEQLTDALHTAGIQSIGWHYIYGEDPAGEANKALQRIEQLGLDGYVLDAEGEYKDSSKKKAARKFMSTLRKTLPAFPIALSSYRFPSYHPSLPWKEFLDGCDYNMPQVYWKQAHNAGEQLTQCVLQFQAMAPYRPVIPTGAAFRESGWQPAPGEVQEFLLAAKKLNLTAANFWEWSDARSGVMPGVWETVRDFNWAEGHLSQDICQEYIDCLNTHDPQQIVNLYTSTAVHITSARTVQGTEALLAWYRSLFNQILPSAEFTLTGFSGEGNSRYFSWTAASPSAMVDNGNDTFGLTDDQIAYHYSFFTVTPRSQ